MRECNNNYNRRNKLYRNEFNIYECILYFLGKPIQQIYRTLAIKPWGLSVSIVTKIVTRITLQHCYKRIQKTNLIAKKGSSITLLHTVRKIH